MSDNPDPFWRLSAACRGMDTNLWFPSSSRNGVKGDPYEQARAVCETCPVKAECLEDAIATDHVHEPQGMRGGYAPWTRVRLAAKRRKAS